MQFVHLLVASAVLAACAFARVSFAADPCHPVRTFADGKQPHREIFISPDGSDTVGDGVTKPFRTIRRALQGVQPGDALRLLPGTYESGVFIENLAGTAEAPIWLGGKAGEGRPVISGGSTGVHLSRVRYLVVENLEISRATANGINCDDGGDYADTNATRNLIFRNLFIHDIGTGGNQDALKLSGIYDFAVLDCQFARMSSGGSGIDHVGCHRGVIARCTFEETGSNAIQCKGGSSDIEIRANRFQSGGGRTINIGGSTGFEFFRPPLTKGTPNVEARNIRVLANVFRGADAPLAFVGAVQCLAANNTIIEPQRWILRILQETVSNSEFTFLPSGQNQFINNLVYFDRAQISTFVNVGSNTDPASFEFANNLWFAHNQPNQSRPALPVPERNGRYGANPLFRDAEHGDFSLLPNSPAAGNGQPLQTVRADLLERCFANPPTIGAWEANPPPVAGHESNSLIELRATRAGDGSFSFQYPTDERRTYRIQARDHLGEAEWFEVLVFAGTGSAAVFSDSMLSPARFFRVLSEAVE